MTTKQILHELLKGMDPFLSCGVPDVLWKLAVKLTRELYGTKGVKLLKVFHKVTQDNEHFIEGWEDGGNTEITPKVVIKRLERLSQG